MGKKKGKLNSYELYKKHSKYAFAVYYLSLFLDAAILFLGLWTLSEGLFWGLYALYAIVVSNVIGIGATYIACAITKKDYDARNNMTFFIIGRSLLLFISNLICVLVNENWHTSEGEKELFYAFIFMLVLSAIGFVSQLFICYAISDKVMLPPKPKSTTSSGKSTSVRVSDSVKETKWYKDKVDEHYNRLMGIKVVEKKPDYSDLDSHDFSHIFKD